MSGRVFIEVTEYRAISSDERQWMLMRRNKKKDPKTGQAIGGYSEWKSYSYYGSFEHAAAALEAELIRECGAQTFTELKRMAKQIHDQLMEVLDAAKVP